MTTLGKVSNLKVQFGRIMGYCDTLRHLLRQLRAVTVLYDRCKRPATLQCSADVSSPGYDTTPPSSTTSFPMLVQNIVPSILAQHCAAVHLQCVLALETVHDLATLYPFSRLFSSLPWPLVWLTGDAGSAVSFSPVGLFLIESRLPFLLGECFSAAKTNKSRSRLRIPRKLIYTGKDLVSQAEFRSKASVNVQLLGEQRNLTRRISASMGSCWLLLKTTWIAEVPIEKVMATAEQFSSRGD